MPTTTENLETSLRSLNISKRETKNDSMNKTFRELIETVSSYSQKEPHAASVKKISSNENEDEDEDEEESEDDEGKGGSFVIDSDSDEDQEVTPMCGKDSTPKIQNRDASRPYSIPNRLGTVNVTQGYTVTQSPASRFFDERNYTNALEWLIDAKNSRFTENGIIEQLDKLKKSIDQRNPNRHSTFYAIFCSPNHEEVTALFFAAIHNLMRTTEYLVKEIFENGFPTPYQAMQYFNKQDRAGNTLLHEMAYVGDDVFSTLNKLFEFRFPDAKSTLFNYRVKNTSQQSPIHYSLENCLRTPQYQMIQLFHTVDKNILKILDSKGNNLLFCFINTCQKAYPMHGNVDTEGLEAVKKYLNILLRFPETSGDGCRELVNRLQQHMEPTVWKTIDSFLRSAKIEANKSKEEDDEIQIIYSGQGGGVSRQPSQEKVTSVILQPREVTMPPTQPQEDPVDNGDMIPIFVKEREGQAFKGEPSKNGGKRTKVPTRKTSRNNSKEDSTTQAVSPGTSPSTSARTYSAMNEPTCTGGTSQTYTHAQEEAIPLFVENMSNGGPTSTEPMSCPSSSSTFKHIVPNPIKISPIPAKMVLKPTTYVKVPLKTTTYSHIQPSPNMYTQIPPTPNTNSLIPPSPNSFVHIPPSPSTYSQINPTQGAYSHTSPEYSTYSQVSPTHSTLAQPTPSPGTHFQVSPAYNTNSQISPTNSTYSQMSPAHSQMSPVYSPYSQMTSSPQAYSQMTPSPNVYYPASPSPGTYSNHQAVNQVATTGMQSLLSRLPATASPDASMVLDAIKGTSNAATTSATKYPTLSHVEQVQNLPAGTEMDLVLNVTGDQIFQVDTPALDLGTMLIDPTSLSQSQGKTPVTDQLEQSNDLDGILTTEDFVDYLSGIGLESEETDKTMPDMDALLSTPQVEKPPFNFDVASRK